MRFGPAEALVGELRPAADKSISHRAALLGAMSDSDVAIFNFLDSADTRATLSAIEALGASVRVEQDRVLVGGVGLWFGQTQNSMHIDVANAGTLLRILPGWLCGQGGGSWVLDGDSSIRRRPVDRIVGPLRRMGAKLGARDGVFAPLTVEGARLSAADHHLETASAQVKSCILIAGLLAKGTTSVTCSEPSRDHTERMLARMGAPFYKDSTRLAVSEANSIGLDVVRVPGDPSSAAFFAAAGWILPGSHILLRDVGLNWTRTGFYRIAERMGATIAAELEPPYTDSAQEPVGDLEVSHSELCGTYVSGEEVGSSIDELPLVALLGAFAEGETVVCGAAELRHKESDRISAVCEGLAGIGVDIQQTEDGFRIHGGGGIEGGRFNAGGDHRLAMLGAICGLASRRGVEVDGMQAQTVSYPRFVDDLRRLSDRTKEAGQHR
jgi:3-phosphoshikimate 1-carboxyvinyltransferase